MIGAIRYYPGLRLNTPALRAGITAAVQSLRRKEHNMGFPLFSLLLINTRVVDFVSNRKFRSFRATSRIAADGEI